MEQDAKSNVLTATIGVQEPLSAATREKQVRQAIKLHVATNMEYILYWTCNADIGQLNAIEVKMFFDALEKMIREVRKQALVRANH